MLFSILIIRILNVTNVYIWLCKCVFMHVYVFQEGKMIWEQELYNQMTYSSPKQFFLSFPADVRIHPLMYKYCIHCAS